mmetsp:Transcript_101746/g.283918  ORF Transcript_101746/g.283918 Transcript_101746/m.283918 type:complete len:326 (+) Transcript_101746:965-1942(+)
MPHLRPLQHPLGLAEHVLHRILVQVEVLHFVKQPFGFLRLLRLLASLGAARVHDSVRRDLLGLHGGEQRYGLLPEAGLVATVRGYAEREQGEGSLPGLGAAARHHGDVVGLPVRDAVLLGAHEHRQRLLPLAIAAARLGRRLGRLEVHLDAACAHLLQDVEGTGPLARPAEDLDGHVVRDHVGAGRGEPLPGLLQELEPPLPTPAELDLAQYVREPLSGLQVSSPSQPVDVRFQLLRLRVLASEALHERPLGVPCEVFPGAAAIHAVGGHWGRRWLGWRWGGSRGRGCVVLEPLDEHLLRARDGQAGLLELLLQLRDRHLGEPTV